MKFQKRNFGKRLRKDLEKELDRGQRRDLDRDLGTDLVDINASKLPSRIENG